MLRISVVGVVLLLLGVSNVSSSSARRRRRSEPPPDAHNGCPPVPECDPYAEFRTPDGSCNNLDSPLDGASFTPFKRYLLPQYEDGDKPRGGSYLPSARRVTAAISAVKPFNTKTRNTLIQMQWGQFLDHDMTLTLERELECCDHVNDLVNADPDCLPLDVSGDPFYELFNITCLEFSRSTAVDSSCSPAYREQINELTSALDGSQVYGSTYEEQKVLREFYEGRLKIGPGEELTCPVQDNKCPLTFLPVGETESGGESFLAGDRRVQEQPGLTSMHTLFVRSHNSFADVIAYYYPFWDDERIFQEARRINIAVMQHITYNEALPSIFGYNTASKFDLLPKPVGSEGFVDRYDPVRFTLSTPNVFATAAFRFGHTLISDVFILPGNHRVRLAENFRSHSATLRVGQYPSNFLVGFSDSLAETTDHFMVETLTNKLFAVGPNFDHGSDLFSRNTERAREHGIPPYNDWRERFGLSRLTSFDDLTKVMPEGPAKAYRSIYKHVDDIDIFTALISESSIEPRDGLVGPLLSSILATHFQELKFGDRFFYENADVNPRPFDQEQLDLIRRTTLATIFCAFTDASNLQRFVFEIPSFTNPMLHCSELLEGTVPHNIDVLVRGKSYYY